MTKVLKPDGFGHLTGLPKFHHNLTRPYCIALPNCLFLTPNNDFRQP